MKKTLHSFFIRLAIMLEPSTEEEDAMEDGFDGIPSSIETEYMSARSLARKLHCIQLDSPARLILSHELNLKLAKEQSKATITAGWIGFSGSIFAVIISLALGYLIGTLQSEKKYYHPPTKEISSSATQPDKQPIITAHTKPIDIKPGGTARDQEHKDRKNK